MASEQMNGAIHEDGLDRIRRLSAFEPLLQAWSDPMDVDGPRARLADRDLLWLARISAERGDDLTISLPGGHAMLPLLTAVLLGIEPLIRPASPLAGGSVALVTPWFVRAHELRAFRISSVSFDEGLHAARLRQDGLVTRLAGGRAMELSPHHRVMVVSSRSGFPTPAGTTPVACVVVDDANDPQGRLTAEAKGWAKRIGAGAVIAFRALGSPADWMLDWPYLAMLDQDRPGGLERDVFGPGAVRALVVSDNRLAALFEARAMLGRLSRSYPASPWPRTLLSASRLARQLIDLAVPLALYDTHTARSIAIPVAERVAMLEAATARKDLGAEFETFGHTDWPAFKALLLTAARALEESNQKAFALGRRIEQATSSRQPIEVVCESRVMAAAVESYLLTAGWAVPIEAFESGFVRVRSFDDQLGWDAARQVVLTAVPGQRHVHRLQDGDLGSPLEVLCYPQELGRLQRLVKRLFETTGSEAADARAATVARLAEAATVKVGAIPLRVTVETSDLSPTIEPEARGSLLLSDAAERAAWAALEDLLPLPGEDDDDAGTTQRDQDVEAVAVLMDPGPVVVLVDRRGVVDRVLGGRILPTDPTELGPGMIVVLLAPGERRSLFQRLLPYLDRRQGPGTRFWLRRWREALTAAKTVAGSDAELVRRLGDQDAEISQSAVREWSSPYRIGPGDPANIARVARIGGDLLVDQQAIRVAAVMRGVRNFHQRVGRQLARVVRLYLAGRHDAVEELETTLGAELSELFADLTVWRVVQSLGTGTARRSHLRRPLTPAEATRVFTLEVP